MKFVRWLGAFGKGSSLTEAAAWETKQAERQVAVEPLWRGRSYLAHARIGLVLDHDRSRFIRGFLSDAWTEIQPDGTLRAKYRPRDRAGKPFRDMDRFLAAWSKAAPVRQGWQSAHGEAVFDSPVYRAVVVKSTATEHGKRRAARLAAMLNLPLEVLPS